MSAEINLLPHKSRGALSEERLILISKIVAVALVIVVVSLSILFFLLSRDGTALSVKNDQSRTIAQLTLLQSKTAKYLIVIDRINKIKVLNTKRRTFDTTIAAILNNIPKGTNVTSFVLDPSELSISIATKDLPTIGAIIDNFSQLIAQKKILKTLTVQGLVSDERTGTFILTLTGGLL